MPKGTQPAPSHQQRPVDSAACSQVLLPSPAPSRALTAPLSLPKAPGRHSLTACFLPRRAHASCEVSSINVSYSARSVMPRLTHLDPEIDRLHEWLACQRFAGRYWVLNWRLDLPPNPCSKLRRTRQWFSTLSRVSSLFDAMAASGT
jgi:hypothetical protein